MMMPQCTVEICIFLEYFLNIIYHNNKNIFLPAILTLSKSSPQ